MSRWFVMLDNLTALFRSVADAVSGTDAADAARADVQALEDLAARHAQDAADLAERHDAEARQWLASRLHPSAQPQG